MPVPFVENAVFFPLDAFSSLVKDQVTIGVWIHFSVFNSIPLIYLSVIVPVPCSFVFVFVFLDSNQNSGNRGGKSAKRNWRLSCRRMRIDPFLSPCTKLKSKWIKDLHIRPETLKLIEEKVGKTLEVMGTGEKFLNRTALACAVRSSIDKWDLIKLQRFCKAKDIVNKTKWSHTDWESIFTNT